MAPTSASPGGSFGGSEHSLRLAEAPSRPPDMWRGSGQRLEGEGAADARGWGWHRLASVRPVGDRAGGDERSGMRS